MNLQNQKPLFVPTEFWGEIEKLSKAALMDMVWDFAMQNTGVTEPHNQAIIDEFRARREIILMHRQRAIVKRGRKA